MEAESVCSGLAKNETALTRNSLPASHFQAFGARVAGSLDLAAVQALQHKGNSIFNIYAGQSEALKGSPEEYTPLNDGFIIEAPDLAGPGETSAVPVPAAAIPMLSALAGLLFLRSRRPRRQADKAAA